MELKETDNATQDEVARLVVDLLKSTKKVVRMSTTLFPDFYNRVEVHKAMEDAAKHSESFKLLLDEGTDVEHLMEKVPYVFRLAADKEITLAKSGTSIPHWLVIDDRDMRLEKPHPIYAPTGANMIVKNADKELSEIIISRFEKMWVASTPIEPSVPSQNST